MDSRAIWALVATVLFTVPAAAESVRTIDGDTIKLDGTIYRLWGIDAAEQGQDAPMDGGPELKPAPSCGA